MASGTFKRIVQGAGEGKKLEPLILNALHDPQYDDFTIEMRGGRKSTRRPDGWFHPSTHPLWPERQLYYYLAEPDRIIMEPLDVLGMLAVNGGTFWHKFLSHILMDARVLKAIDIPIQDDEAGTRGEMDGALEDEAWEFKTMNGMKLKRLPDTGPNDPELLAAFIKANPGYYGQAQEYLRISGFPTMRMTIMEPCYPFTMREIAIPYDAKFALSIRDKYMRVRQAVADQRLPAPCCSPGSADSRSCFARSVCPIGIMTASS